MNVEVFTCNAVHYVITAVFSGSSSKQHIYHLPSFCTTDFKILAAVNSIKNTADDASSLSTSNY